MPPASAAPRNERAIFFDKDGTLIEDIPYNADPGAIRLTDGAADAIRSLSAAGYRLIVITNQSGVARGFFPVAALAGVRTRVEELVRQAGASLAGFYFCPHHPEGAVPEYAVACECRKPAPGLLLRAAAEHGINLAGSWVVG